MLLHQVVGPMRVPVRAQERRSRAKQIVAELVSQHLSPRPGVRNETSVDGDALQITWRVRTRDKRAAFLVKRSHEENVVIPTGIYIAHDIAYNLILSERLEVLQGFQGTLNLFRQATPGVRCAACDAGQRTRRRVPKPSPRGIKGRQMNGETAIHVKWQSTGSRTVKHQFNIGLRQVELDGSGP